MRLLSIQRRLAADGIDSSLEGSRRGGHLRVFFMSAVAPDLVRRWLLPYCPDGVEFYPKRDWATWEEPGSLMRVPFGVHRLTGLRYPFLQRDGSGDRLVPAAQSVAASLDWLATIRRVPVPLLEQTTAGMRDGMGPDTNTTYPSNSSPSMPPTSSLTVREWCLSQDALAVIGRYVVLDARGMGCCPFGEHHQAGGDRHPSLWVYLPHRSDICCWWCHTWQRGGSLFDFLRLRYGVSAGEMWRRILTGEVF